MSLGAWQPLHRLGSQCQGHRDKPMWPEYRWTKPLYCYSLLYKSGDCRAHWQRAFTAGTKAVRSSSRAKKQKCVKHTCPSQSEAQDWNIKYNFHSLLFCSTKRFVLHFFATTIIIMASCHAVQPEPDFQVGKNKVRLLFASPDKRTSSSSHI